MKEKTSFFSRFLGNLNRLIPYVGFLFVITGILGLIFVQKPLEESQELRSDASQTQGAWPSITAVSPSQDFYIDENSQISLNLNADNIETKSVEVVFNIINSDIETPVVTINAGSSLKAESIEVEKVGDGYLVGLKAVPNNIVWNTPPNDTSFIKISFISAVKGTISINFDEDNTILKTSDATYAIDDQTINFDIKEKQNSASDDGDDEIKQCNETCDSNASCEVGSRCFDTGSGKKCRLATNPSSSNCSSAPNLGLNKQCNEYCANSRECDSEFSCWSNKCRNPNNVESASCSGLTQAEETSLINSCGESCSSNADCAINLRCYDSACRLATNPSSATCSVATEQTVSKIYDQDSSPSAKPLKKGDNLIPDRDLNYGDIENVNPATDSNLGLNGDVPADETVFDLLVKMLKDKQQNIPTTIVLTGVGLLVIALVILLISKLVKPKRKIPNMEIPNAKTSNAITRNENTPGAMSEPARDKRAKELIEKLNEQSRNQNQG